MGPTLNLLRDGVTEACALLRACGAAELIDQDQRVLRGVLDDVVDVGALDGEGRALVEHVVAAEEREDLIRHPERRKLCGNLGNPVRTEPKPKFGAQKLPQYLYIRCVRSGWRGSGKAPRDGKSDSPVDPLLTNSPITRVRGACVCVCVCVCGVLRAQGDQLCITCAYQQNNRESNPRHSSYCRKNFRSSSNTTWMRRTVATDESARAHGELSDIGAEIRDGVVRSCRAGPWVSNGRLVDESWTSHGNVRSCRAGP